MTYIVDRYNCSRKYCVITNLSCNLNCIYCYQNKKPGDFNVSETLDCFKKELAVASRNGSLIKLLGGEPFLVFDKIKDFSEALWSADLPEKFLLDATSNGTLIHGATQDFLHKNKDRFVVKLSIDGDRQSQDINRPNSFDKIDLDFFNATWPEVGVKMTISPKTINRLYENVVYLHTAGVQNIECAFAALTEWDEALTKTLFVQLEKLSDFYLKNHNIKPCSFFRIPFRRTLNTNDIIPQCSIGRRNVLDYYSRKCYPCLYFLPSVSGKRKSDEMLKLDMTDSNNLATAECQQCPFVNICDTCYASNYLQRGSTAKRDKTMRAFNKVIFKVTSEYLYKKYVVNKEALPNDNEGYNIYKDMMAIKRLNSLSVIS